MKVTSVLLAVGLLSGPALAQINYTVGPATVPLGSRVSITLSNDNPTAFGISEPLFEVFDELFGMVSRSRRRRALADRDQLRRIEQSAANAE